MEVYGDGRGGSIADRGRDLSRRGGLQLIGGRRRPCREWDDCAMGLRVLMSAMLWALAEVTA